MDKHCKPLKFGGLKGMKMIKPLIVVAFSSMDWRKCQAHMVPEAGLEPARSFGTRDFKSHL